MERNAYYLQELSGTDPEFSALFRNFAYHEVAGEPGQELDKKTRYMVILATLLGCQGSELFRQILPEALENGVTPVEAKEIIYQAVAYLGIGRVYPFLGIANEVMKQSGIMLPLAGQSTAGRENRVDAGEQAQVDVFGESFRGFHNAGPDETRHINRWLSGNCFGDYYTRKGLDLRQREMITFCFLSAQGTEIQLKAHIGGNAAMGNDKKFLIAVASQCMPYIGYPRTLNTLRCINEMLGNEKETEGKNHKF